MNFPSLKMALVPVDALVPQARNPRTHTDEQIRQVAASIREFGWTNPVLIDEDRVIIAGHCRLAAARSLGATEVPTLELRGLTPAQKRALVIADNKLALNAGWDEELLRLELAGILDATPGLTCEDEVPDPPAEPTARPGDLWLLGRHRLLCGDSTVATSVERLLGDARPHLMVTDPPYGVEYDPEWRNEADRADGRPLGARATGRVANDDRADWREAWALFPGDVAYVWHAASFHGTVQASLEEVGFQFRAQIVWGKSRHVISRGHYHWQHETCLYMVRKGATAHWAGDRSQTTLWPIEHTANDTGHGTQKPVDCMRRPILNHTVPGDAVYEPFSGSGTTIIAAETTGRICFAIELDPAYVDVAVKRWEAFTGQQARLADATGEVTRAA